LGLFAGRRTATTVRIGENKYKTFRAQRSQQRTAMIPTISGLPVAKIDLAVQAIDKLIAEGQAEGEEGMGDEEPSSVAQLQSVHDMLMKMVEGLQVCVSQTCGQLQAENPSSNLLT
jgi:hypothetical protein